MGIDHTRLQHAWWGFCCAKGGSVLELAQPGGVRALAVSTPASIASIGACCWIYNLMSKSACGDTCAGAAAWCPKRPGACANAIALACREGETTSKYMTC